MPSRRGARSTRADDGPGLPVTRRLSRVAVFTFAFVGLDVVSLVLKPWAAAVVVAVVVLLGISFVEMPTRAIVGRIPTRQELLSATVLIVPLIMVSLGTIYLLYWPLSFYVPGFVEELLSEDPSGLRGYASPRSVRTFLSGVGILVVAVVIEEVIFRGLLLRGLARRFGVRGAIVTSACVFGVLHVDVLGATVFGVVMGVLYVRTQSLLVPIAVHTVNNLAAFVAMAVLEDTPFILAEFQSYWWIGMLCLLVGLPWVCWFTTVHWRSLRRAVVPGAAPAMGL